MPEYKIQKETVYKVGTITCPNYVTASEYIMKNELRRLLASESIDISWIIKHWKDLNHIFERHKIRMQQDDDGDKK